MTRSYFAKEKLSLQSSEYLLFCVFRNACFRGSSSRTFLSPKSDGIFLTSEADEIANTSQCSEAVATRAQRLQHFCEVQFPTFVTDGTSV
jgi:hypothetical protein